MGLLSLSKKPQKFYLSGSMITSWKSNADKCDLLLSINNTVKIKIWHFDITKSKSEKLLGVKFDHELSFDDHIWVLCK